MSPALEADTFVPWRGRVTPWPNRHSDREAKKGSSTFIMGKWC